MAPTVRHTGEGAARLRKTVKDLKKKTGTVSKSKMGITTFIQRVLRNGVKFSPRRNKSNASRSGTALARGRAAHRLIEKYCKTGQVPPPYRKDPVSRWVRGMAQALVRAGIEPLRCELPCELGTLRTNVDLLGMVLPSSGDAASPELVCVEFKTTSLTQSEHTAGYDAPCARRAVLGSFGVPNSEREAHRVQVAFGIEALKRTYAAELRDVPIRACVIVASMTSTVCYDAKPIPPAHYEMAAKMSAICGKRAVDREKLSEGRLFPAIPPVRDGGAAIRALLKRCGHTRVRASRRASCLSSIGGIDFAIGIVEDWATFSASHRRTVTAEIEAIAGSKKRAALVVFDPRKGLWEIKYV